MAIEIHFGSKKITVKGAGGKVKTLTVKGGLPAIATVVSKIVWKYIAKGSMHIEVRRSYDPAKQAKETK